MSLTISDKDRPEPLELDGKWHPLELLVGGVLATSVVLLPGTYVLVTALHGRIVDLPETDLEVRVQRYPSMDSTAWASIALARRVTRSWFGAWPAKCVAPGAFGIDYRGEGGEIVLEHRILKFVGPL